MHLDTCVNRAELIQLGGPVGGTVQRRSHAFLVDRLNRTRVCEGSFCSSLEPRRQPNCRGDDSNPGFPRADCAATSIRIKPTIFRRGKMRSTAPI
jgi:hypothetical protein